MKLNEIQFGDAYELIKTLPDKSVDLIFIQTHQQIWFIW